MNKRIPDQDIMDFPGDAGTSIYPGGNEAVMSKLINLKGPSSQYQGISN